jgi:hypothetical protein
MLETPPRNYLLKYGQLMPRYSGFAEVPNGSVVHLRQPKFNRRIYMRYAKKPLNRVLEFTVPRDGIGRQLVSWVRGVVKSNDELVHALTRLRRSYKELLAGKPDTDAEAILWQVEGALQEAGRSKNLVVQHTDQEPQGA